MSQFEQMALDRLRIDAAELTSAALLVTDTTGIIVWANSHACRLLGYHPTELTGGNLGCILPELRLDVLFAPPGQTPEMPGKGRPDAVRLRCKDGTRIDTTLGIALTGTATSPLAIVTIEDPLIHQKALELSQQMARVNRLAMAQLFSGGILHDFNNILSGIAGHARLAKSAASLQEVDATLDEVLNGTDRCIQLVQRLRGGTKDSERTIAGVMWHPIAGEALSLLRSAIPSNMQVKLSLDGAPFAVACSGGEAHQIVMNLGLNALDAMAETGGTLTVSFRTEWLEDPSEGVAVGQYVCLVVEDDGCGMDEATRKAAFEPFFSTKPPGTNRGLGLAIVSDIVARRRGFIRVDTKPGYGTRFRVYLPTVKT